MAASYRAEIKQSFDVAEGFDAQQYFADLPTDPTNESGTAVTATTDFGTVTIPFSNILGVIFTENA